MENYDIKDLIENFGDDFINNNIDFFKEWLSEYAEFIEWDKDNDELSKDPDSFYGVNRNE